MQINDLTFRIGELASYVTLIERRGKFANRRKYNGRLDDYHRFLVGYNEHDYCLIKNTMNDMKSMSILLQFFQTVGKLPKGVDTNVWKRNYI